MKSIALLLGFFALSVACGPARAECYTVTQTGVFYDVVLSEALLGSEPLPVGAEVAVLDSALVVGARVYEGVLPIRIAAWQADPDHDLPGWTAGHAITVEVCFGEARKAGTVTWSEGGTFGEGALSVAGSVAFPVYGACCFDFGVCVFLPHDVCTEQAGFYVNDNTPCDPVPCVVPEKPQTWGSIKGIYR